MDISKLDIKSLLLFDAIYKTQNLSAAANVLDSSQPAVSRSLAKLRLTLNDPLFTRQDSRMVPTAKAVAMSEYVKATLENLQFCVNCFSEFQPANTKMNYRIGLNDLILSLYAQPMIDHILSEAPGIDLSFVNANYLDALDSIDKNKVDVAVISHYSNSSRYSYEPVFQDDYVTISRQGHSRLEDGLSLERFVELEHILITYNNAQSGWVDDELAKIGKQRKVRVRLPFFSSAPLITSTSELLCTLPRQFARYFQHSLPLDIHSLPIRNHTHTFFLVWLKRFDNDPAHRWLRNRIKSVLMQSIQAPETDG